jgi:hypothetical protein
MPRLDLLSKNLEAISTSGFLLFLFYLVLLFYWVGIHCDIYKSSYNISNISHLNSPPSTIILYCPFPSNFWNSFNRYVFIYIHVCTVFILYSPSCVLSPPTTNPPHRTCSALLVSDYVHEQKMIFLFI